MKVLLTGGSGFIAAHVLDHLLAAGHAVVTTVRSEEKGEQILKAHADTPKDKLSYFIVPDISIEGAFDKAVVSDPPFDAVQHTASPFHHNVQDPVKDFLNPAIVGTTGILKAVKAHAPSVKRVVITSSFASIINAKNHKKVYSEEVWNPVTWEEALNPANTYRGSKTFAEKAAWEFVEKEKPNFSIATICPPIVIGPVIHHLSSLENINTSNSRTLQMLQGKMTPSGTYIWVDVRDLALAHVRAMEVPEAANQRFFITAGHYDNKELLEAIRETHPELNSRLPSAESIKSDLPDDVYGYDNSKSIKVLGIKYTSLKKSASDTVDSLLALGA